MERNRWNISLRTLRGPLTLVLIFFGIGIWRFVATGKIFFVYNFGYIGSALALGSFLNDALPKKHILWGCRIAQVLVASTCLGFSGSR